MTRQSTDRLVHPLVALVFGAICISFAPIFFKWVGVERLGPTAIAFWRTLFGGIALLVLSALRGRTLRLKKRLIGFAVLAGFLFFLDLFGWHHSIVYCGAGMSTILANTQVFFTALLGLAVFGERLTGRFLLSAVAAIIGIALLVGFFSEAVVFTGDYILGITLGLITGLVYANYIITLKRAGRREQIEDVVVFIGWASLVSAAFLGPTALIKGEQIIPPDLASLALVIAYGVVCQAIGWWAITGSLRHVQTSRAGLVLLMQPTLAAVWGVIFFAEQFTILQVVGAALTLIAIYFGGLSSRVPQ